MISWSDTGIVLSAHRHGEKYKIVNVFTKSHGNVHAMASYTKNSTFSVFSDVDIDYSSKDANSLGFWKLKSEKQNWVLSMNSEKHLLVCQGLCFLLNRLLPQGVAHPRLFEFTRYISANMQKFSGKDILLLYAYFEFSLLEDIGFSLDNVDLQSVPKLDDFEKLPGILNSESVCSNARKFLHTAGKIIEQNLLSIDNCYRSAISQMI